VPRCGNERCEQSAFMVAGDKVRRPPAELSGRLHTWKGSWRRTFPSYGAERRGAPVAAFARIANEPIRERGLIVRPVFVVIADAPLIQDPAARVLDGVEDRTVIFVIAG